MSLLKFIGVTLITLGSIVAAVVLFGLGAIHHHAHWFLESHWGPDGQLRHRDDAYDTLFQWATQTTQHGTQAEQRLGVSIAAFLVIIGFVLCLWARDRNRLRELTKQTPNDRNA